MDSAGPRGSGDQGVEQRTDRRTRRQERREQTRTALLDAAERLWAERGIHGASLDEIATAAGLTKGAVYSNFAGKTDLLLALLDRYTQANLAIRGCAEQASTEDAKLVMLLLVEFWLYGMRDYAAGWRIADWYDNRRASLASGLTDGEEMSAAERATMAMAMDLGLTLQHLLDPERVPAETYASGMRLVLGPAPAAGNDCMITAG
jgi:AcrR family transcriptional regulator